MVEATQQTQIKTLEDPFEKKMIEVFVSSAKPTNMSRDTKG